MRVLSGSDPRQTIEANTDTVARDSGAAHVAARGLPEARHSGAVHNMALSWRQAAVVAAALGVAFLALRVARRPGVRRVAPWARESCLIAALYALWQLAGEVSVAGTSGAFARADWIRRVEHDLRLPSEHSVQQLIIDHSALTQAANIYYATMHFGVLFVFLVWLFLRHRGHYAAVRTTLALTTGVCLLIQLMPVAPPRLTPGAGFVDTAAQYGQSVYTLGLGADELSAMPSVHVAWALLVGWYAVRIGTSRWRWLGPLHAAATVFVVVSTANHWWLDGAVAGVVLAACALARYAVALWWARWRAGRRRTADEPVAVPVPALAPPA
jgi:hypothetical protein